MSFRLRPALIIIGVAIAAAGSSGSAWGIADHDLAQLEIPLVAYSQHVVGRAALAQEAPAVTSALENNYGGNWHVYTWNAQTGTPSALYGSGALVATGLRDDAEAERVARDVIAANPLVFRADNANLRFMSAPTGLGKRAVHFQQTYEGLDVYQGRVHLTFTEAGRLFVMGSDYYPGIDVSPVPSLSLMDAQDIAAGGLPFNDATDTIEEDGQLLILPLQINESSVEYHLVWQVRLTTESPLGRWMNFVDAHSGEILARDNEVCATDFLGNATSDVQWATYCNPETTEPCPHLNLTVSGAGSTTTDADANWVVGYGGSGDQAISSTLEGPYVHVTNYNGSSASFNGTATAGVPFTIAWTDANARQDERDVFDAVNDIHDFFQGFDPDWGYVNQQIQAYVNRNDGYCPGNAWWDGTINFCAAGAQYANTGEIQGVVHHEFGHGIQWSILGAQGNEGLGEGNSDIMANLMTQESIIGRGFFTGNCTSGIRDSDNDMQYPEDLNGSVHNDGQIIAGFNWDFMVLLQGEYGSETGTLMMAERWHYGRVLEHPFDQPAQVLATFIADDDDGNLDNGTPHHDFLCEAATNHSYDCPEILVGVIIIHEPLGATADEGDRDVVATIYSTEASIDPSTLELQYKVDGGGFNMVALTATGNPDEFSATIPGQSQPAVVEYYLYAADLAANEKYSPPEAPAVLHAYEVGLVVEQEEYAGWQVDVEGTDDASTGIWILDDPVGTGAQPEDDHTPDPGVDCWVTGNGVPGGGMGVEDVDDGSTSVYSAYYDLTNATTAVVKYWRWYSNDKGGSPNADNWQVAIRQDAGAWQNLEFNMDDQNSWVQREFDLVSFFGGDPGNVQLKFVASDLGSGSLVEAAVDDFVLMASFDYSDVETDEATASSLSFALYGTQSNPVVGPTQVSFQVPAQVETRVSVYDVSGRLVNLLANESFAPGAHSVGWDGRDTGGEPVGAGVYFIRMQAGEFNATRAIVVSQ